MLTNYSGTLTNLGINMQKTLALFFIFKKKSMQLFLSIAKQINPLQHLNIYYSRVKNIACQCIKHVKEDSSLQFQNSSKSIDKTKNL